MKQMNEMEITLGTTNVFADLGYADAPERQTKTRLALAVNELLKARKLKQQDIAKLLHIPQPKVSALKHYRLDQFSVERLMEFLTALDQDVEIMIRPRPVASGAGHISVLAVQMRSVSDAGVTQDHEVIRAEQRRADRIREGPV